MYRSVLPFVLLFILSGCGSSSSDKPTIDLVEYLPKSSMNKNYVEFKSDNGKNDIWQYTETIMRQPSTITTKIDNVTKQIDKIADEHITRSYFNDQNGSYKLKRNISLGDTIFTNNTTNELEKIMVGTQEVGKRSVLENLSCELEEIIDNYKFGLFEYHNYDGEHNIIKIKCITQRTTKTEIYPEYRELVTLEDGVYESKNDISYIYMQKELGKVATVNEDCIIDATNNIIDDLAKESKCEIEQQYHHIFYYREY